MLENVIKRLDDLINMLSEFGNAEFIAKLEAVKPLLIDIEGLNELISLFTEENLIKIEVGSYEEWEQLSFALLDTIEIEKKYLLCIKKYWEDYDFNSISDDMLEICLALLNNPKAYVKVGIKDDKKCVISNIVGFCDEDIRMDYNCGKYLLEAIRNKTFIYDNGEKQIDLFTENTSEFKNDEVYTSCFGCRFSQCPKSILGYLSYLKENGLLEEKLKSRKNKKSKTVGAFDFQWKPKDGLKYIPEYIFELAEKLVDDGRICLNRKLSEDGKILIWCKDYTCSDIRDYTDLSSYSVRQNHIDYASKPTASLLHSMECNYACRKEACPALVGAYIEYLRLTGQENLILEDREYYKNNQEEVLEKIKLVHSSKIRKSKNISKKKKSLILNAFNDYVENVENLPNLIDALENKIQNNLYAFVEGDDGLNKDKFIYTLAHELLRLGKIDSDINQEKVPKVVKLSMFNMASMLSVPYSVEQAVFEGMRYLNIESRTLYVLDGISEFLSDYNFIVENKNHPMKLKEFLYALDALTKMTPNTYIVIDGSEKEIDLLMQLDSRFKYVFDGIRLKFKNLDFDALYNVYKSGLEPFVFDKLLENEKDVKDRFVNYVLNNRSLIPFKNIELANYLSAYSNSHSIDKVEFPPDVYEKRTLEESLKDIIGLEHVKQKIKDLEKFTFFCNKASAFGLNMPDKNMHMLFTGNPGSGKTTIARIMAKMLYDIGILKENKLTEVGRKDLVAEYIGQTAPKTAEVINKAIGGVLFIDEAYSLTPKDAGNDFGQEVISTLIKAMEDHKNELVVIFAGYKKEMETFVSSNSGIASRIGYSFDFPDYNYEELYEIFMIKMKKAGFTVEKSAQTKIKELTKFFSGVENIGNGRFIDKVVQEVLLNHSKNYCDGAISNISTIKKIDIPTIKEMSESIYSNREFINPEEIDLKEMKKTAVHEAGHAFMRVKLCEKAGINTITINPEGTGALGYVSYTDDKKYTHSKKELLDKVKILLAGIASEKVCFGDFENGGTSDLERATNICRDMITRFGMSRLGLATINEKDSNMNVLVMKEINKMLDECFEDVFKILSENKETILKIANYLVKHREINEETLLKIIK